MSSRSTNTSDFCLSISLLSLLSPLLLPGRVTLLIYFDILPLTQERWLPGSQFYVSVSNLTEREWASSLSYNLTNSGEDCWDLAYFTSAPAGRDEWGSAWSLAAWVELCIWVRKGADPSKRMNGSQRGRKVFEETKQVLASRLFKKTDEYMISQD